MKPDRTHHARMTVGFKFFLTSVVKCASVATSLNIRRVIAAAMARHMSQNTTASMLALSLPRSLLKSSRAFRREIDTAPSLRSHKSETRFYSHSFTSHAGATHLYFNVEDVCKEMIVVWRGSQSIC